MTSTLYCELQIPDYDPTYDIDANDGLPDRYMVVRYEHDPFRYELRPDWECVPERLYPGYGSVDPAHVIPLGACEPGDRVWLDCEGEWELVTVIGVRMVDAETEGEDRRRAEDAVREIKS